MRTYSILIVITCFHIIDYVDSYCFEEQGVRLPITEASEHCSKRSPAGVWQLFKPVSEDWFKNLNRLDNKGVIWTSLNDSQLETQFRWSDGSYPIWSLWNLDEERSDNNITTNCVGQDENGFRVVVCESAQIVICQAEICEYLL